MKTPKPHKNPFATKGRASGRRNARYLDLPEVTDFNLAFICPGCGSLRTVDDGRYYAMKGPQPRYRKCKDCTQRSKVILTGSETLGMNPNRRRPEMPTEKKCPKCAQTLAIERFHKSGIKYASWCRECINTDCARRAFAKSLKGFGLTPESYAAAVEAQGRRCPICSRHESEGLGKWTEAKSEGKKNKRIQARRFFVIDHDHKTGKFRGLLCYQCNLGVGNFADDPARLLAAAEYLRRHSDK